MRTPNTFRLIRSFSFFRGADSTGNLCNKMCFYTNTMQKYNIFIKYMQKALKIFTTIVFLDRSKTCVTIVIYSFSRKERCRKFCILRLGFFSPQSAKCCNVANCVSFFAYCIGEKMRNIMYIFIYIIFISIYILIYYNIYYIVLL